MSNEFNWTIEDVENLLSGSQFLICCSMIPSSFDNNELILNKPRFINQLIHQISKQDEKSNKDCLSTNGLPFNNQWGDVKGVLRWLLNQALLYNFNTNDNTEARLYFSPDGRDRQCHSCDDEDKKIISNDLEGVIKWFPNLAKNEIRKDVNTLTLLVETLPPKTDSDVELTRDNRVATWKSFNDFRGKKMIMKIVDKKTEGSNLKLLTDRLDPIKRYGLQFEGYTERNMYKLFSNHSLSLRDRGRNVVLTLTFLVGELQRTETEFSQGESLTEEFIVNDYGWTMKEPNPSKCRGISVERKAGGKKFDLFLHGAISSEGINNFPAVHRIKIASTLNTSWFYTLQVKWPRTITSSRDDKNQSPKGFYKLFESGKVFINGSFHSSLVDEAERPAFYIGGLNTGAGEKLVKSNCFLGILTNLEIMRTIYDSIPKALLNFIASRQMLINDDWKLKEIETVSQENSQTVSL